jgi:Ca2+-binding EF-hand superfamily protein
MFEKDADLTEIEALFASVDTDRDGLVSRKELKSALRRMGREASDVRVDAIMRQADNDGDGLLDKEEFLFALAHRLPGG